MSLAQVIGILSASPALATLAFRGELTTQDEPRTPFNAPSLRSIDLHFFPFVDADKVLSSIEAPSLARFSYNQYRSSTVPLSDLVFEWGRQVAFERPSRTLDIKVNSRLFTFSGPFTVSLDMSYAVSYFFAVLQRILGVFSISVLNSIDKLVWSSYADVGPKILPFISTSCPNITSLERRKDGQGLTDSSTGEEPDLLFPNLDG